MPPKVRVNKFSRAKVAFQKNIKSDDVKDTFSELKDEIPDEKPDKILDETPEPLNIDNSYNFDPEDDFLSDLNNDVFVSETVKEKTEKERKKEEKERELEERKMERERKKYEKIQKDSEKLANKQVKDVKQKEDDTLFSERGTELFGRDKLELIARINQYKVLFPENKQLKALKIKKNPSVEDLHAYLAECQAIVDTDCVEAFATETILQSIRFVEMGSSRTKYNIKGLANALKQNPQFTILCKQLYLKYKVFSAVPPELQLGMLIISTAYVVMEKNKNDAKNEETLNKQIDITNL